MVVRCLHLAGKRYGQFVWGLVKKVIKKTEDP
jgi:hypothetical protein